MTSLRRVAAGSLKLCAAAGDRCFGSRIISRMESLSTNTKGSVSPCGCDGSRCGRPLLHVAGRQPSNNSVAALVCSFHNSVSSASTGLSELPLLARLTLCRLCSKSACNTVVPLVGKRLMKCSSTDISSGCLPLGTAAHEFCSSGTCKSSFLASDARSGGYLGLGHTNVPHSPHQEPFLRIRQWLAVPEALVKGAHVFALTATAKSCESPKDHSLVNMGSFGCSRHLVRNRRSPKNLEGDRRFVGIHLPLLAMSIATALVVPLKGEEEQLIQIDVNEVGGKVAEKTSGVNASASLIGCILKSALGALEKPFHWHSSFCKGAMISGAAEVLQERLSCIKRLLEKDTESKTLDALGKVGGNVQEFWRGLQEHVLLLAPFITQFLGAFIVSTRRAFSIGNRGTQGGSETLEAKLQHPGRTCQSQPVCSETVVDDAEGQVASKTDTGCVISAPGHAARQMEYRQESEGASGCSANPEYVQSQPGDLASGVVHRQHVVSAQVLGWMAAFARAIGSFLQTLASVCHRLFFVVPLAFAAATAGLWLFSLPYISAGVRLLGVESHRVLRWEVLAQHELEEVIFTAITAAASAAGPTYVKFLQWIATRPDLFHESLCVRCAKLQTAVRPFSYPRAALLLRDQFGDDVGRYLVLDPSPIGCGCIAQVYRAYLLLSQCKDSDSRRHFLRYAFSLELNASKPVPVSAEAGGGRIPPVAVAVKIMRPGVREEMEFDLRMMLLVASAVQCLPSFGFIAIRKSVEEFAVAMRRQLDFGLEENHLKHFRANFGLPSPSVPDDLLPLHNRCRSTSEQDTTAVLSRDRSAMSHHGNILSSLPLKVLGMHRQVSFPYPFEALSSSEVLVMTLEGGFTLNQLFKIRNKRQDEEHLSPAQRSIHGQTATEITGYKKPQHDLGAALASPAAIKMIERFNSIGMICLHSFLQMVFLDNFFHGDMHSGNLLCRFARDSKELIFPLVPPTSALRESPDIPRLDGPLELVVLDCGLAGSLSQADRVNFVTLLEAVAKKHGGDAAMAMLQRAHRNACKDEAGFCSEVEKLIDDHHFEEGNSMQMIRVRFTSLMARMLSLSKRYCVELDPSFVSIVVAMSILEGVGAQLCPEVDVLKTAMPYSIMAAKALGCALRREC